MRLQSVGLAFRAAVQIDAPQCICACHTDTPSIMPARTHTVQPWQCSNQQVRHPHPSSPRHAAPSPFSAPVEWELSKENVQPRRKGRRVGALNKGLAAADSASAMDGLLRQQKYASTPQRLTVGCYTTETHTQGL